jgi:hypothetical protein
MRLKLIFVLTAGAVLLTACGGGLGGAGIADRQKVSVVATPEALVQAASQTAAAHTGRFEMTIATSVAGHDAHLDATGAFDADQHLYSLSMDFSSLLSSLGGTGGSDGSSDLGGMFSSLFKSPLEIVATSDTIYIKFPFIAQLLGAGTEWISVESDKAPTASSLDSADPTAFLDFVRGAGGQVTTVGREQVRGVDTTHMQATITLSGALDQAPAAERDEVQKAIDELGPEAKNLLDTPLPIDVFIDDNGMVRRIGMTIDLGNRAGSVAVTVDFFDFGADVGIAVPPADQVTDVTSTFGQLTGRLGGG